MQRMAAGKGSARLQRGERCWPRFKRRTFAALKFLLITGAGKCSILRKNRQAYESFCFYYHCSVQGPSAFCISTESNRKLATKPVSYKYTTRNVDSFANTRPSVPASDMVLNTVTLFLTTMARTPEPRRKLMKLYCSILW